MCNEQHINADKEENREPNYSANVTMAAQRGQCSAWQLYMVAVAIVLEYLTVSSESMHENMQTKSISHTNPQVL